MSLRSTLRQLIYRHIKLVKERTLFTTRDLLGYGKRNLVDQFLYELVRDKNIIRVTSGVFMKPDKKGWLPKPLEAVQAKIKAYAKTACRSSEQIYKETGRFEDRREKKTMEDAEKSFVTGAGRCKFKFFGTWIIVKNVCSRRVMRADEPMGEAIRYLWQQGKQKLNYFHIATAGWRLGRDAEKDLLEIARYMPYWARPKIVSALNCRATPEY